MTSARLRDVYRTRQWRVEIRREVLERAGGQCQMVTNGVFGQARCEVRDITFGGLESLTIDHTRVDVDPFDVQWLQALCRQHHGVKDGGRRVKPKKASGISYRRAL